MTFYDLDSLHSHKTFTEKSLDNDADSRAVPVCEKARLKTVSACPSPFHHYTETYYIAIGGNLDLELSSVREGFTDSEVLAIKRIPRAEVMCEIQKV